MIKLLLSFGIQIVSRLSIANKFVLIFVLYLIPVGYVAYYAITEHQKEIDTTQQEIEKLDIIKEFSPLISALAKSRGLTNSYLNGNPGIKNKISQVSEVISSQLTTIRNHSQFSLLTAMEKEAFNQLKEAWKKLHSNSLILTTEDNFSAHSTIIKQNLQLIKSISESTSLFTDSEHQTSFLIKIYVQALPELIDVSGKTRGIGSGIATLGKFTSSSFISLSNYTKQLEQLRSAIAHNFSNSSRHGKRISRLSADFSQLDKQLKSFIENTTSKIIDPEEILIDGESYFSIGSQVIRSINQLNNSVVTKLIDLLQERQNRISNDMLINISASILLVLAAMYLFASVYSNMLDSIFRIKSCVNHVAEGDLTSTVEIHASDEFKVIGDNINKMIKNTKSLVQEVLNSTDSLVNSASTNITSSANTNEQIEQQNVEIEQVATAMKEMSATVQEVANNAEQTATSTAQADKASKAGLNIVKQTILSINELANELNMASSSILELQSDVKSISSILDVIQGIADQTNLLALNAAIEAARAGESGRGFAVVADEVRTLASKTQESTGEIRNMIEKLQSSATTSVSAMASGNVKSEQTVTNANEAGEALHKISESVAHISLMGEQIASAATEQTAVADEINRNIDNVKVISENTGKSAKDSTENSRFLNKIANNLQTLVSKFKV